MSKSLEDLINIMCSHYLRVLPQGFEINPACVEKEITVRLLDFSPARTLYEKNKPVCRSLNAAYDLKNKQECASCNKRLRCTLQFYLEVEYKQKPLRLILSYTSARNFTFFCSQLKQKELPIINTPIQLTVLDRGRWGEVRFSVGLI